MGSFKSLFYLKPFIKKHKLTMFLGFLGIITSSLIYMPIPYLIGYILDNILIKSKNINNFYKMIFLISILYMLKYFISVGAKFILTRVEKGIVNEYRTVIIKKILNLPMSFFQKFDKGYVQGKISESRNIGNIFSPNVITILVGVIEATFSLIAMIFLSYKLSIVVVIIIPLFFISSRHMANKLVEKSKEVLESEATLNKETFEILNGIEEIKILNGIATHLKKFSLQINDVIKKSISQSKILILFIENIYILNYLGTILILLISGIMILNNHLTIGLYTAFTVYSTIIFQNVQSFTTLSSLIKPICVSIERLQELLDIEDEDKNSTDLIKEIESITLKEVSFKYQQQSELYSISNVNANLKKGDKVFIKGENGSGKSTLVKLILGLYNPCKGEICINNKNINNINKLNLRNRIGIVSQKIFLFNGTVYENIVYSDKIKTKEDVNTLIDKMGLKDYFKNFPDGLETILMQNSGLSGGQSQIIAFLRAVIGEKDILIFDEPFAGLDYNTKSLLSKKIALLKNNFIFMISHEKDKLDFINKKITLCSEGNK